MPLETPDPRSASPRGASTEVRPMTDEAVGRRDPRPQQGLATAAGPRRYHPWHEQERRSGDRRSVQERRPSTPRSSPPLKKRLAPGGNAVAVIECGTQHLLWSLREWCELVRVTSS